MILLELLGASALLFLIVKWIGENENKPKGG